MNAWVFAETFSAQLIEKNYEMIISNDAEPPERDRTVNRDAVMPTNSLSTQSKI